MFPFNLAAASLLINLVAGIYIPESGEDWTLLKPQAEQLEGSYNSVPFKFGLVVNQYVVNLDGDYQEPEHVEIPRSLTTSIVTAAPKPTKAANVLQIADGQIQRFDPTATEDDYSAGDEPIDVDESHDDEDGALLDEEFEEDKLKARSYGPEDEEGEGEEEQGEDEFVSPVYTVACQTENTLSMTLQDGILRDSNERIGSIVTGHQFQFDGPVPQFGAVYAAGWSITDKGHLSLGDSTKFYQCASGEFYNLYNEPIGYQCNPVTLDVVELTEC